MSLTAICLLDAVDLVAICVVTPLIFTQVVPNQKDSSFGFSPTNGQGMVPEGAWESLAVFLVPR